MKQTRFLADIKSISFAKEPLIGKKITLVVKGFLRDSAWKLGEKSIQIDRDNKVLFLKIPIHRDSNQLAMQVIENFRKEIDLVFPDSGKWLIKCNNISEEIQVKS